MKITINVDCTPEEARTFLGLPDVTSLNEAMVASLKEKMEQGFDPDQMDMLMRAWTKSATSGFGEMQKGFWSMMQDASKQTD